MKTFLLIALAVIAAALAVAWLQGHDQPTPAPRAPEPRTVGWIDEQGQPIRPARYRHR